MRYLVLLTLVFVVLATLCYGATPTTISCRSRCSEKQNQIVGSNELPFTLYRGYTIIAHGSVGNLKNLNFVVDTGAVPSILDKRIARQLHLTGTSETVSVLTHNVNTKRAVAPNVTLGPMKTEALPVVIRDLSFASDALGSRVDVMIGFDFLGRGPFMIDYENRKIVFGPIDPSLRAMPYEAHPGYALVELKIKGQSLGLLLDTGASDLVLFASAIRNCQDAIKMLGTQTWSNMGGEIRVQQVQLMDAHLGATSWDSHVAFVMPDDGSHPDMLQGLLGVSSLKARRVGFDPERKVFAWDHKNPGDISLRQSIKSGNRWMRSPREVKRQVTNNDTKSVSVMIRNPIVIRGIHIRYESAMR
jgi:predicted aspartyl protease